MTYPISEIEGLPAFAANKLKAQGIRTTDALLEAASTAKGRKALSAKTGISEQQLLEWANVSDYMRIPGMGRAKVGLVRAAGVTTVRELAYRNPARLAQSMREANDQEEARPHPALGEVGRRHHRQGQEAVAEDYVLELRSSEVRACGASRSMASPEGCTATPPPRKAGPPHPPRPRCAPAPQDDGEQRSVHLHPLPP